MAGSKHLHPALPSHQRKTNAKDGPELLLVKHLPVARPLPPTFFPAPLSTSLQAGPDEPFFTPYATELSTFLARDPTALSPEQQQWRQQELHKATEAIQDEVEHMRGAPASSQVPRKRPSTPPTSPRTPSGAVHRSGGSGRSFSIEIPTPTDAQRRSLMFQGHHKTESQKAGESGVESPMKKVRIAGTASASPEKKPTSSGRGAVRTGENRDVIDRLSYLVEECFRADDALIGDTSNAAVGSSTSSAPQLALFRSSTTNSEGQPLLQTMTLTKLARLLSTASTQDKGSLVLEELEADGVGRLLKLLERSWSVCDSIEPWEQEALQQHTTNEEPAVPSKSKKGKGRASPTKSTTPAAGRRSSRSRSPTVHLEEQDNDEDHEMEDDMDKTDYWTNSALEHANDCARSLSDALSAIRCALLVLTCTPLPPRLYSADFLTSLLATLRLTLSTFLVPLLTAPSSTHLALLPSLSPDPLSLICDSLSSAIPLFASLVQLESLDESLVIATLYCALEPFFHEPAIGVGKGKERVGLVAGAMKGIRLHSLGLVRAVFGRYPDQRGWVVQEVLDNLTKLAIAKKGKGTFKLRNGQAIHTVSALLLHLVQTCPADLAGHIHGKLSPHPKGDTKMKDEGDESDAEGNEDEDDETSPLDKAARDLLDPALDDVLKSARTIIGFLLSKSCKSGKAASGSTEQDYRNIFDNLVADVLATLHLPEWPGAELLLTVCCKSMMTQLMDPKTSADANALKGVALDHIGQIAARIRFDNAATTSDGELKTLHEIIAESDVPSLNRVFEAQQEVLTHLERSEKTTGDGAAQFTRAIFGRDLILAGRAANGLLDELSAADVINTENGRQLKALTDRLAFLAKSLWSSSPSDDVFGPSPDEPRIDLLALQLSRSQPLAGLYKAILDRVIAASDSTVVAFRTKSLRAISLIVAQDPDLFLQDDVSSSIRNRIVDASPAVRDAAIELVGKYVVGRPELAVKYLPVISERITDTGLSVRRRVVKLLRVLFSIVESDALQTEICRKLVWRALDDDEGVKELAAEAIEDIWFSSTHATKGSARDTSPKPGIARLAQIIMAVTGVFGERDRPPPVEEVLRQITAKHVAKGTKPPLGRLKEVMENLIDGLLEQTESFNIVECVKTVYILNAADPSLLSTSKTELLLPFLKSATTPEEHTLSDFLLKIFRSTVSALPKGSSEFSRRLQAQLTPMISKPSSNLVYQQEIVACFCAVVRRQTHDFTKMVGIYKQCLKQLMQKSRDLDDPTKAPTVIRAVAMLCNLTALLAEHGQFDELRKSYKTETKAELDAITTSSISEHLFNQFIRLYNLPPSAPVQSAILTSLGYLYRGFPSLMLEKGSTGILDNIFNSNDERGIFQALRIIQDFLASQDRAPVVQVGAKAKEPTGVKIEELVGNVDGFADSGVGSAIAQRYTDKFFAAAMAPAVRNQRIAVDIICSIARSGFTHPLGIAPVLVALSATPDATLANKAFGTLTLMHQKYSTILATQFFASAKVAHEYALKSAGPDLVRGYHGPTCISHFGRWYSLLQKEKRQHQLDYLKQITKNTFDLEVGTACSPNDVSLRRYVAEALSTLEYKRQEELMTVIHYLNAALAVTGLQVVHLLEEGLAGGGGLMASITPTGSPQKPSANGEDPILPSEEEAPSLPPSADLARQSVVCGIALLLRDHLKKLYNISDAKMAKFQIGKKSAPGDRPVARRADAPIALGLDDYERLPYAVVEMATPEQLTGQRSTYCTLISEDGTINSFDDEQDLDDDL
ncbi:hypothetical protein RQP46_010090 [Phenoliferia psychrophenolica]